MSHAATPATRSSDVSTPAGAAPRSPDAIQAEMETTRERLATTIDQLVYRANPRTIAKRALDSVKARFVDDHGQPRTEEIAKAAAAVVGALVVLGVIRRIAR